MTNLHWKSNKQFNDDRWNKWLTDEGINMACHFGLILVFFKNLAVFNRFLIDDQILNSELLDVLFETWPVYPREKSELSSIHFSCVLTSSCISILDCWILLLIWQTRILPLLRIEIVGFLYYWYRDIMSCNFIQATLKQKFEKTWAWILYEAAFLQ